MSHREYTPDDPRLTAFVLGELDAAEAAAVQAALADSPELREAVAALRETSAELFAALQSEPLPSAVGPAVVSRPALTSGDTAATPPRRRSYLLVNVVTLVLLVGVLAAFQYSVPPPQSKSLEDRLASATRGIPVDATGLSSELAQQLTVYNDLIEQQRFAEAHAIARQARQADPANPVAAQMYFQSKFAATESGGTLSSAEEKSFFRSLQEVDEPAAPYVTFGSGLPTESRHTWPKPSSTAPGAAVTAGSDPRDPLSGGSAAPQPIPATAVLSVSDGEQSGGAAQPGDALLAERWYLTTGAAERELQPDAYRPAIPASPAGGALPLGTHTIRPLPQSQWSDGSQPLGNTPVASSSGSANLHPAPYRRAGVTPEPDSELAEVERLNRSYGLHPGPVSRAADPRGGVRWNRPVAQAESEVQEQLAAELREGVLNPVQSQAGLDAYTAGHPYALDGLQDLPLQRRSEVDDLAALIPGTESYAPIIENDFIVPVGESALSTFSLDVDTASYANVRRFLTQQRLPPPDAVRLEELVNYFDYDLPQPSDQEPFTVTLEATSCPWNPLHRLVRIGLKGRELDMSRRPQTRLVFLLDVSGSMSDANKLPLVKESMKLLVEQLGENDRIAIVTYSDTAELKLDTTPGSDKGPILAAIDSLHADGSTNGAGGIQLAYETATKHFAPEAANRVILCTDGDFNVGVSDDDALVKMIEEKRQTGVFLSVFGYGMGNLKDAKLEQLADKGNGHYGYIDDLDEARKVFLEELTGTLYTIAKDVKLQVEFNPARVGAYRLLGYENRLLAAADFNNDAVDAGELGAGHTVTALYEIAPLGDIPAAVESVPPAVDALKYRPAATGEGRGPTERAATGQDSAAQAGQPAPPAAAQTGPAAPDELLTVKLRYKQPTGDESVKREFPLPAEPTACSKDLQFAAAVTGFGLLLRNSQYAAGCNWDLVIELAEGARGDDVTGRRGEFIDLARQARRLWDQTHPQGRAYHRQRELTSSGPPAAGTAGRITEVTGEKFAVASLGYRQGIQDGQILDVLRIGTPSQGGQPQLTYLGALRVIDVQAETSVGQFAAAVPNACLQVGDRVLPQP